MKTAEEGRNKKAFPAAPPPQREKNMLKRARKSIFS